MKERDTIFIGDEIGRVMTNTISASNYNLIGALIFMLSWYIKFMQQIDFFSFYYLTCPWRWLDRNENENPLKNAHAIHSQFDVAVRAQNITANSSFNSLIKVPIEKRPPLVNHNPVTIEFSIFVVDINSINVEDMDFRVDMFVHQKWLESRLTLTDDLFEDGDDYITLQPEYFENLWQPDPYFLNSKVAGELKLSDPIFCIYALIMQFW